MRAAERLIAEQGIENVTIRDILATAGQKNTSALQYHFKNLPGLISALRSSRNLEIDTRRQALIRESLAKTPDPPLREICRLMVAPAFQLASSNPGFRRYIRAFGHEITLAENSALEAVKQTGSRSTEQLSMLMRGALPHLDNEAFNRRMDGAVRFISASMIHHARQQGAFQGRPAELFFSSLIDALEGLLSAPESEQTRKLRASRLD
jgi:AcrR family transcriptional regulator